MRKIIVVILALCLVACANQPAPDYSAPGLLYGLWHGIIAPWAFFVSLFTDIRIYQFPNSGCWYDFGFLLGIGAYTAAAKK
jgi:hypothetical protein